MFTNNVSVVLSGSPSDYKGMSVAWATLIEKDHVVVSLHKDAPATQSLRENKFFSVNILDANQLSLAKQFGGRKFMKDRDESIGLIGEMNGVPIINNCYAVIIGGVCEVIPVQDQLLGIAKRTEQKGGDAKEALIFTGADYT